MPSTFRSRARGTGPRQRATTVIIDRKWTTSYEEWRRRKTEARRRWFARQRQRKARAIGQSTLAGSGEDARRRTDSDREVGHPPPGAKITPEADADRVRGLRLSVLLSGMATGAIAPRSLRWSSPCLAPPSQRRAPSRSGSRGRAFGIRGGARQVLAGAFPPARRAPTLLPGGSALRYAAARP